MIRILATDGIEQAAAEALRAKGFEVVEQFYPAEELGKQLKDFDVLVVRSATKVRQPIIDEAAEAGRLKLVIRGGVGIDNIDAKYAEEKGIAVRNTPNASSISVAELTLGHILAVTRFVALANVTMRDGKWEKKKYEGVEIFGKTIGLVGFGRIAKEVAKRAHALGMKVKYTDICGKAEGFDEFEFCDLNEIITTSDFVSMHIPFSKADGALIGEKELNAMKDGAFVINCSRGGIVDEAALLAALNSGKIAGAALDVFEDEPTANEALVNHPRVSVTPHIGASTVEAQKRIGEEIVETIEKFF
ncbi:MAG: D-2-hydroxyacid dehydrogenase [Bacillota bacterium]|nr:D-2-hydroxyacid dehydrogenase [Bacillota bacterium]